MTTDVVDPWWETSAWLRSTPNAARATLPLSEQFGPTIQGEGPHAGMACQFLRLGGCNLACTWCDTPYTWNASLFDLRTELNPTTAGAIVNNLEPNLPLVISGGEPLLHQESPGWEYILRIATRLQCDVHIETNGTILPNRTTRHLVNHYSVSPKLANAGEHKRSQNPALHPGWMDHVLLRKHAILKYVVTTREDCEHAVQSALTAGWARPRIWLMPLGTSVIELQALWPTIAKAAADLHVNATHRTHVLAWGDKKGT